MSTVVTLESLVKDQPFTDMTDIQIITAFIKANDVEEEALEIIYDITKEKIRKIKEEQRITRTWLSMIPSKYLYETYDLDTADMLHALELDFISYGCKRLTVRHLEWAKKNVPNIVMPRVYYRPLVVWLDKEHGIRFIDKKKEYYDYE